MKDRSRKRQVVSLWSRFFWCTLVVVFFCVLFTGSSLSTVRLLLGEKLHPEVLSTWRPPVMKAMLSDSQPNSAVLIRDTVILPDHVLLFLEYPHSARLFTKEEMDCVYLLANSSSSQPQVKQPPDSIDGGGDAKDQIVRCPLSSHGSDVVSLAMKSGGQIQLGPTHRWDSLVYEAMIDYDNTTILFVKGLNLRPEKIYNTSRFECLYGWDFKRPKFILRSNVISIAQEIARCQTPLSILSNQAKLNSSSIKVSIRVKGRGTFPSIARPVHQQAFESDPISRKPNEMCICTMLRNQARFLKEWVVYHAHIGVERWFIYDNNSDDEIDSVIESLVESKYNISRHLWPWVKTQEAGFAHCALRARAWCEWVGFIDVDEYFHLPTGLDLPVLIKNQTETFTNVAEIRAACHSFGPSGLKEAPPQGVMVGYTCRLAIAERHKSIVKPEALNSSLINVVHHFHLKDEFRHVNVDRSLMVINHYKYQVWEVFKQKFQRRVATYVVDWQNEQNVGSKDRTPGLGTRPVEPPDWFSRFCEVNDTGLRDRVVNNFLDPLTNLLPWQEVEGIMVEQKVLR
ncbi:glycosyltransferase family 92 protein RCOM_0530710-like [Euphorbia lathyris]|uniref:glycosyltransferase family 92 protein RCOM_0530710-like n=1 Tax=Euphorbia lathyris TaxID=212925 RepID=UPI003313FC20